MDEWHKRNPDNVVILSGDLLTTSNFPTINAMSQTNPNTEMLAGQLIVAQERVGNMPTFIAPYMPGNAILITPFKTSRSTTSVRPAPDDQRGAGIQPRGNVPVL